MRRGRDAQPVTKNRLTDAQVHRPALASRHVESCVVIRECGTEARRSEQARPGPAQRDGVHRNPGAGRIRTVDGLADVAQSDAAVEQAELPEFGHWCTNGADQSRRIDGRRRLNRLDGELEPTAVFGLRGIPDGGGGAESEGGRGRERRTGYAPERRTGSLQTGGVPSRQG